MSSATAELESAAADIPLTRDAREILERATHLAESRGAPQTTPADVLEAMLHQPRSLAGREMHALGVDLQAAGAQLRTSGAQGRGPSLRQLIVNANREAGVLGHYQVDSIHLLLAMLYSDSPGTAAPLQTAGLTLYDLRRHLQTGGVAGTGSSNGAAPDAALRRRPWPSLRGVMGVSPIFIGIVAVTALAGILLWNSLLPQYVGLWITAFVVGGWIVSLCIHEFGHALVAYLGGDRSVAAAGYLSLNPLRYQNLVLSIVLPIVFLLLGGIALPGGAVYINHSALRTRAWSSAVAAAGPAGTALCGALVVGAFTLAASLRWIRVGDVDFFSALAVLGFFLVLSFILNLLPVPGLDGFGIIRPWLPHSLQFAALQYGMVAVYGVFLVLWLVAPVRHAFYGAVYALTAALNIPVDLVTFGLLNMRFF